MAIFVSNWIRAERPHLETVITPRIRANKWIQEEAKDIVAEPPVSVEITPEVKTPVVVAPKPKVKPILHIFNRCKKSDYFGHMVMSDKHQKSSLFLDPNTKKHKKCTYMREFIET
jgi:hypothetical protein